MAKIVLKQGSWGMWQGEVDGVAIDAYSMDPLKVLLMGVVKHLKIDVEYEIFDGQEDRMYKVDDHGELCRVATEG